MHICSLSKGHINHHKALTPSTNLDEAYTLNQPQPWNKVTSSASRPIAPWSSTRGASYGRGRGRVGKAAVNPHRNRTLVLRNTTTSQTPVDGTSTLDSRQVDTLTTRPESHDGNETLHSAQGWVTKRDRHMQLINSAIYDKETQTRNKAIEETRKQKALRRDQREKQKIERHLRAHEVYSAATPAVHEITVNGLRFHILDGGSKLARIRGETCEKDIVR